MKMGKIFSQKLYKVKNFIWINLISNYNHVVIVKHTKITLYCDREAVSAFIQEYFYRL